MPNTVFYPKEATGLDAEVFIMDNQLGLRPDYDNGGELPVESVVTFQNWSVESLDEFWAVQVDSKNLVVDRAALYDGTLQAFGAIDCRPSVDGGITYLFWDVGTTSWLPITGSEWTSLKDLNIHLNELPFAVRQLRLKFRLRRGTPTQGPVLNLVRVGFSLLSGHEQEDVSRTVKRFLLNNVRVNLRMSFPPLAAAAMSLDVTHPLPIFSVVEAYNLTVDPTRSVNISAGFTAPKIVNFTGLQPLGSVIEIEWKASVPVRISNPDADTDNELLKHIPLLLVQLSSGAESKQARFSESPAAYTVNYGTSEYWNENPPIPTEYRVTVWGLAADEVLATKLVNAGYRTLRDFVSENVFRMVLTGSDADVLDFIPPYSNLTDTSQNLSSKAFTFILYVREFVGTADHGPLVETLQLVFEE